MQLYWSCCRDVVVRCMGRYLVNTADKEVTYGPLWLAVTMCTDCTHTV